MEGNCVTCSDSNGEKLCQIKLKELIVDYDENKNTDIEFAIIGENFGGRLLQYHQLDILENFHVKYCQKNPIEVSNVKINIAKKFLFKNYQDKYIIISLCSAVIQIQKSVI